MNHPLTVELNGKQAGHRVRTIGGRPFGLIPEHASQDATLIKAALDLGTAADGFAARAKDISDSLHGFARRGELTRGAVGQLLPNLETAAGQISTAKAALKERMSSLSFTPRYGADGVPGHQPFFDLAIVQAFGAKPAAEKAAQIAMLKREPFDLFLADALQRVPPIVSGVDRATLEALRVAGVKHFKRAEVASVEAEVEHLAFAQAAVRAVVALVVEATGTHADLHERAPQALAVAADSSVLSWSPAEVEA